jgi:hypothetical protein
MVTWLAKRIRWAWEARRGKTVERKLEAIRAAAQFESPSADIDFMLEEIEQGYLREP